MRKQTAAAAPRKTLRAGNGVVRQAKHKPRSQSPRLGRADRPSAVVIGEQIRIPLSIVDHQSYRQWACSDDFPEHGWVSYLNGAIWVDPSMERLTHNKIKTVFLCVLASMVSESRLGHYLGDRMLLTNLAAALSTEPDGMFVSHEALRTGRVLFGKGDDTLEVLGSPDMALEIVSTTSVRKDTVELMDAYWRAGIAEYWLVDPRGEHLRLDIFRRGATKYTAVRRQDGWVRSVVFGKSFRLTRKPAADGISEFTLHVR